MKYLLIVTGLALALGDGNLVAQENDDGPGGPPPGDFGGGPGGPPPDMGGPGNMGGNDGNGDQRRSFDPAQFQKQMLERMRDNLSITNADEWAAIQPLIQKVMEAQREVGAGGMGGPPGGRNQSASAEQQALKRSVDEKASLAQVKDALARFRAARKDKEAKLEVAQNNLKVVLNTRQEAQAVLSGLLP